MAGLRAEAAVAAAVIGEVIDPLKGIVADQVTAIGVAAGAAG